jgi:hypothetical protein
MKQNKSFGIAFIIMLPFLAMPNVTLLWDLNFREKPWISAELSIIRSAFGPPDIRYIPMPTVDFTGYWKAWTRDAETGKRLRGSDGTGNYSPAVKKAPVWSWGAFFEKPIPEPRSPYQVCVSYHGELNSGAHGSFGPFCSATYDPREEIQ